MMSRMSSALVAHYKMNDNTASTTVVDSQGYSNGTARQNTDQITTTGKMNSALSFNGVDDYVNANDSFESTFQSDFSVSAWFKPTDGNPAGDRDILGTSEFFFTDSVLLYHNYRAFPAELSGTKINFAYYPSTTSTQNAGSVFVDGQETWHHVVGVVEQTTATTITMYLYLNNVLVGSDTGTVDMTTYSNPHKLYIGQGNHDGTPTLAVDFDGDIDNVMIFNTALTPAEIRYLYNDGQGTEILAEVDVDSARTRRLSLRTRYR